MIEVRNVSKRLGSSQVLNGLSFNVPTGQTTCLLGLSGSGKTTALKLICGLYEPDEGEILLNGAKLSSSHLSELRRKLGYVIQGGGLFPHLTALENLTLVSKEAGWSNSQTEKRLDELSQLTKITRAVLSRYPRELSGGQRQRVGLMRALFLDPSVLLLDEPMGALDPITREELQNELKALFSELKKTVLLVTHDLIEASHLADQIILLHQGRIIQAGSLENLLDEPATEFVQRFVRSQQIQRRGSLK